MNINDPAGVKALLDQLRASQAWQEAMASQSTSSQPASSKSNSQSVAQASNSEVGNQNTTPSNASVASLLSQLQASSQPGHSKEALREDDFGALAKPVQPIPATPAPQEVRMVQDPRSMTFQQALPHLAKLADNPRFVSTLVQLKKEQDDLERQLWQDRRDIYRKYEEKVKVATTKASMIGDEGLSKHEADMLQDTLKKALDKFDRDRALYAWDGLISKQQAALEQFGVPTMFQSIESADRERQQRVMQVLGGILQP